MNPKIDSLSSPGPSGQPIIDGISPSGAKPGDTSVFKGSN